MDEPQEVVWLFSDHDNPLVALASLADLPRRSLLARRPDHASGAPTGPTILFSAEPWTSEVGRDHSTGGEGSGVDLVRPLH